MLRAEENPESFLWRAARLRDRLSWLSFLRPVFILALALVELCYSAGGRAMDVSPPPIVQSSTCFAFRRSSVTSLASTGA